MTTTDRRAFVFAAGVVVLGFWGHSAVMWHRAGRVRRGSGRACARALARLEALETDESILDDDFHDFVHQAHALAHQAFDADPASPAARDNVKHYDEMLELCCLGPCLVPARAT